MNLNTLQSKWAAYTNSTQCYENQASIGKKRNKVLSIREKCNKNQASRGLVEQNIDQQGQNATQKKAVANQASMGKMISKIRLAWEK